MNLFLLICVAGIMAGILLFMLSRTVFYLTYQEERLFISITIVGCGIVYDDARERVGVVCGPIRYFFAPSGKEPDTDRKKEEKREKAKTDKQKRARLSFAVIVQIVKALIVFAAEVLSRIRYDGGRLEVVPVLADPALAGMSYGWSQALYGAFPGLRRAVSVQPTYGRGESTISGHLRLSIRNGSIIGPLWRLLRNLPIKQIIRNRFTGRGG